MLFSPPPSSSNSHQQGLSRFATMLPRMTKRRLFIYIQVVLVFALALYLTFGSHGLSAANLPAIPGASNPWKSAASGVQNAAAAATPKGGSTAAAYEQPPVSPEEKKVKDDKDRKKTPEEIEKDFEDAEKEKKLVKERVQAYIPAIMNSDDTSVKRLKCPKFNETRYEHLKASKWDRQKRYFFALNLKQCHYILPRLLGSITEVMRFLGPESSVLSIVEGRSTDGTAQVLNALRPELEAAGITYFYLHSDINPDDGRRIEHLAELRNQALEPMVNSRKFALANKGSADHNATAQRGDNSTGPMASPRRNARAEDGKLPWGADLDFADDTTVAFINDVAICADDILELLHQRKIQDADMTCAMDWSHIQDVPTFYDQWVARQINGDSFFDIPAETGSFDKARYLFPDDELTRARFAAGRTFHVFACWNGAVTFKAEPVMSGQVRFRDAREGECRMGEPTYFCKDLWFHGHGKIAVVPTVNLEYDDDYGATIKKKKGFASEWTKKEHREKLPVEVPWQPVPEKILCMPGWKEQSWIPWNQTLA